MYSCWRKSGVSPGISMIFFVMRQSDDSHVLFFFFILVHGSR